MPPNLYFKKDFHRVNMKMSYCWFNKQESFEKVKEKYDNGGKEKLLDITK